MGSGHLEEGVTDVAPSNYRQNWAPICPDLVRCVCASSLCVCVFLFLFS